MEEAWLPDFLWAPQRRAISQVISDLDSCDSICVQSPTGSGKSTMAAMIMRWAESKNLRTIFYVNRRLLIPQIYKTLRIYGIRAGIRAADYDYEFDPSLSHQVASVQTDYARCIDSDRWEPYRADLMIVDEAHIQKGKMLDSLRKYAKQVVGFSATPVNLKGMFDHLVVAGTLEEFRSCKALVPCVVKGIEGPDMRKVKRNAVGEYLMDGTMRKRYTQTIVGSVYENWKRFNPDARPALLYAPGVSDSVYLTREFRKKGVNWAHVDATDAIVDGHRAKLTDAMWKEMQERLKGGDIKGISSRFKCLSMETEVLTRRGWLGRDQITTQDEVATVSIDDMSVSWESGCKILDSTSCRFVECDNNSVSFRVTDDHNLVTRTTNGTRKPPNKWRLDEAASLISRGQRQIPVAAMGEFPGVELNDYEIGLMAWAVTDGHIARDGRLVITQSPVQPASTLAHIEACLGGSGLKFVRGGPYGKTDACRGAYHYRVAREDLRASRVGGWLDRNLDRRFVRDCTRRQLEVFLHAAMLADGSKLKSPSWTERTFAIHKGNRALLDAIQEACVVRGIRANRTEPPSASAGPQGGCGALYWSPDRTTARLRFKQDADMSRNVVRLVSGGPEPTWCLSTKNGTLITRRRGRVAIVGNCREGIDLPYAYHAILATPVGSVASYVQIVGRILRYSPETPDQVLVTDHGGNYITHGSPNAERPWARWFGMSEYRASIERDDQIRSRKKSEPIRCPYCFTERSKGSKCPAPPYGCGAESPRSQRVVIQANGDLVTVDCGSAVKKHRDVQRPDTAKLWERLFWGYRKKGVDKSFRQLRAYFHYLHGYRPPEGLPYMPKTADGWYMKPKDIPMDQLHGPDNSPKG